METKRCGRIRVAGLVAAGVLLLLTAGCLENRIVVNVNPDGSGNLVVARVFSRQVVTLVTTMMDEQKKMMRQARGELPPELKTDPFFNLKAIEREARTYGKGVTLVKAERYDQDGDRGFVAVYAFKDVTALHLAPPNPIAMLGRPDNAMGEEPEPGKAFFFAFEKAGGKDGAAKLTIKPPAPPDKEEPDDAEPDTEAATPQQRRMNPELQGLMQGGNVFGLTGTETTDEAMQIVMRGLNLSITVEVNGKVAQSTATHPVADRPGRFRLLELDMNARLASPEGRQLLKRLAGGSGGRDPEIFFARLQTPGPGALIECGKDAAIEFK